MRALLFWGGYMPEEAVTGRCTNVSHAREQFSDKFDSAELPDSVTFFFPYREVSGVPVLFGRMARHLATQYGLDTRVIDYADGYMAQMVRSSPDVTLIEFVDGHPLHVSESTLLVMQSSLPFNIRRELRVPGETRIVFWTLYHLNLVPRIIPWRWFKDYQMRHPRMNRVFMKTVMAPLRRELRCLVETMNAKRSLLFMDGATLGSTEVRLGVGVKDPIFVPVACDDVPKEARRSARTAGSDSGLSFGWVGRLADFKVFIFLHALDRLSTYAARSKRPICYHIVGGGSEAWRLKPGQFEHRYFQIRRRGVLTGLALDDFLVNEIDVLTAMGTSALEGAKWGIPTILLDASYGPVRAGYRFRWLFESDGFSLAEMLVADALEEGNDSLEQMMDQLLSPHQYDLLSWRTYDYCAHNHSLTSVGAKLVRALAQSRFRYRDFRPAILRKSAFRKTYEAVRKFSRGNA